MKKLVLGILLGAVLLAPLALVAQDTREWIGHMVFRQASPDLSYNGTLSFKKRSDGAAVLALSQTGASISGTLAGRMTVVSAASGTTALTTAQSGAIVRNTGTSGTTTFTLPTAATAGLYYCFVEAGDAAGELLVNPQAAQSIIGKTHGAENGTGIATAGGTGIKNTAATNVKGDHTCLVSDGTSWLMYSVAGVWASQ